MKSDKKNLKKKSPPPGTIREAAKQRSFPVNHPAGILIGIIAFLAYANTINFEYVLDDSAAIVDNQFVKKGLAGIPDLLKTDLWHFSNLKLGYYRPLSLITFAIEHELFNNNATISHLLNVIFFAFSGYMLFIVLSKIFNRVNLLFPFAVTLLFITHPVHTEVVANVKSRDEILSFLNVLAAAWFALKFFDSKKIVHLIGSLLFFYLGLLSKETAIAAVILIPVILYFRNNISEMSAAKKAIPYLFILALFLIQKRLLLGTLSGMAPDDMVNYPYRDPAIKLPTTFLLFAFSIKLLILPHPLRYDYSFNQIPGVEFGHWAAIAGVILFIAGIAAIIIFYRRRSPMILGLIIIYVTLLPSLAFTILRGGIFAERFLFFPSMGFCILVVSALSLLLKTNFKEKAAGVKAFITSNVLFSILIFIITALYFVRTFTRNLAWKNEITLFSTDLKTGKNSTQNLRHYGTEILRKAISEKDPELKRKYAEEAVGIFKQAIRIHPKFSEAYNQIGTAFQEIFLIPDSAIYYYNKSIEASPGLVFPVYNLGTIYQILGNNEAASYYYNEAIKLNPTYLNAINAKKSLQDATGLDVHINPLVTKIDTTLQGNSSEHFYNLGNYYASRGDYVNAAKQFQRSIDLDPGKEDSYINLANSYGMLKEYEKSISVSEQLLARNPNNIKALENLAITYRSAGNNQKAEECIKRANALRNQ